MKAKTDSITYLETQYAYETAFHERILAEFDFETRQQLYFEAYRYAYQQSRDLSPDEIDFGYQPQEVQLLAPMLLQKEVIDYGCGYGSSTLHLAQYAHHVTGYDILPEVIEVAQGRLDDSNRQNASFAVVKPAEFPVADQAADIVYASDVVEHLHPEDALHFLKKASQALRPDGKFICITPHRIYGPSDITKHFQPKGATSKGFHLLEYDYTHLVALMRQAGFKSFRTPCLSPRHMVKLPAYKLLFPLLLMPSWVREKAEGLSWIQHFRLLRKLWGFNRSIYIIAGK